MKKKQIKTGVEILISILGLLALYWIDLYAIKIQFSEHLNKFVTDRKSTRLNSSHA